MGKPRAWANPMQGRRPEGGRIEQAQMTAEESAVLVRSEPELNSHPDHQVRHIRQVLLINRILDIFHFQARMEFA